MSEKITFDNPEILGCYDLTTSQVNKEMNFTTPQTFIEEPVVIILCNGALIDKKEVGNGIIMNPERTSMTLTLNGTDYKSFAGKNLQGICNFFIQGDREFLFDLEIIESHL